MGLHYIAYLVARPGCELHPLDLERIRSVDAEPGAPGRDLPVTRRGAGGDDMPFDPHARRGYRRRLVEIGESLGDAACCNDLARVEGLKAERDLLADELMTAVAFGGRDCALPSDAERARVGVTIAIRSVVKKLQEALPDLGWHLAGRLRVGRLCSYEPEAADPIRWIL